MKSKMGEKCVKNSFFKPFVENRPHLKFNFTYPELLFFFNFVNVSCRNWPVWIPVGSQKVVLNEGILKNFIEQTQTKIKFKKYYICKNFQNFASICQ